MTFTDPQDFDWLDIDTTPNAERIIEETDYDSDFAPEEITTFDDDLIVESKTPESDTSVSDCPNLDTPTPATPVPETLSPDTPLSDTPVASEEEEWEIEKLVARRPTRSGKYIYQASWKGWGPEWDEWKTARELRHAQGLVDEYEARLVIWETELDGEFESDYEETCENSSSKMDIDVETTAPDLSQRFESEEKILDVYHDFNNANNSSMSKKYVTVEILSRETPNPKELLPNLETDARISDAPTIPKNDDVCDSTREISEARQSYLNAAHNLETLYGHLGAILPLETHDEGLFNTLVSPTHQFPLDSPPAMETNAEYMETMPVLETEGLFRNNTPTSEAQYPISDSARSPEPIFDHLNEAATFGRSITAPVPTSEIVT